MSAHVLIHPAAALAISAALIVTGGARQQPVVDFSSAPTAAVHETDHLTIRTSGANTVVSGARVTLVVDVTPKPRMHVYAPAREDYIPVSLTLEKSDAFKAHPAVFPVAEKYFFKPVGETQLVYSKPFKIRQDITVARAPGMGERASPVLTISGTLRYQACDDTICYLPNIVRVRWTVGLTPQR